MNDKLKEIAVKAQLEHCVSHVRLEEYGQLIVKDVLDYLHRIGAIGSLTDRSVRKNYDIKD
jgi:hypothetical protein